ncbi:MAG TPA: Hsp20/alpha crystallin family protein [Nocardioides sp.]|nr:Hsp20/alpha crystallin family protein [Nocardioides sp.]
MESSVQRHNGQSLVGELMAWLNAGASSEPEVRVEEWIEGDKRILRADIPGVDPQKDIDLTVEGTTLHLSGQRREEEHDEYHTEIRYGRFERLIGLPPGTTAADVSAQYEHGVLTVTMPARVAAVSTKIPVTHRELPVE